MLGGMSGSRTVLTCASTAPGESSRAAVARSSARVVAITSAAGTPLSVTSPTTSPGRPVVRGQLPAGELGELLGQEGLLDQPRHAQLLLDPLALPGLPLLLADQLGDPHRRRR